MRSGYGLAAAAAWFGAMAALAGPIAAAPHATANQPTAVAMPTPMDPTAGSAPMPTEDFDPASEFTTELEDSANANPEVLLDWSEVPGVFENDLFRRSGNALYLESRRRIAEAELLTAKRRDAARMWESLESFIDLLSDKNRMSKFELASQMGDALLRIDEATWSALRVGGRAYELAATIQETRSWLLDAWRVSSDADPGVKALLDAEARIHTVETGSPAIRFLALIQAADLDSTEAPIQAHEFGVALMSEELATIRTVYQALRGELKETLALQLAVLLDEIERDQIEFEQRDQKVAEVVDLLGLESVGTLPLDQASSLF
jgi:hypothetical protein